MYMKGKIIGFTLLLIGIHQLCFSQIEEIEGRLLRPTHPGGIVETSELPPPKIQGSNYIYDAWKLGNITLKDNKSIKNIPLKYDLTQNILELSTDKGIKVIYSERIDFFEWLSDNGTYEIYANANLFKCSVDLPTGFFEIILDGKLVLVAKKQIEYIAPHYNQALDAGNEDGRYLSKEIYYYIDQQNNAIKIPRKKKEFYKIFGNNSAELESYVKEKKYGIKDRYALKKIFEFHNSLVSDV